MVENYKENCKTLSYEIVRIIIKSSKQNKLKITKKCSNYNIFGRNVYLVKLLYLILK